MFDDEIYDPVLDELQSISGSVKELCNLLEQQISIERANNVLLRRLLQQQISDTQSKCLEELDVIQFKEKNILVVDSSKDNCFKLASKIADMNNKRVINIEANSPGELCAVLNNASEGDIVFLDITSPTFNEEMCVQICSCIQDACMNLTLGKGSSARIVNLELPKLYFVIYTDIRDMVPEQLMRLVISVN